MPRRFSSDVPLTWDPSACPYSMPFSPSATPIISSDALLTWVSVCGLASRLERPVSLFVVGYFWVRMPSLEESSCRNLSCVIRKILLSHCAQGPLLPGQLILLLWNHRPPTSGLRDQMQTWQIRIKGCRAKSSQIGPLELATYSSRISLSITLRKFSRVKTSPLCLLTPLPFPLSFGHPRARVLLPGHRIYPSRAVQRASEPDQELAQSLDECLKHGKPPEHPITSRHLDLPSAYIREP